MGLVGPGLWGQPDAHALLFHVRGDGGHRLSAGAKSDPHHARGATAPKRPHVAKVHIEPPQSVLRQRIGHRFDQRSLDIADKTNGQMEIGGRGPSKVWRHLRAIRDETRQHFALRLGHRQPEERADPQRTRVFFFQFSWAHWLGRVGRQPKRALTESIPSAMLSS